MALQCPFVSWDFERYPCHLTRHGAFYYVITPGGLREMIGRSIDRGTGDLIYSRDYNFVSAYSEVLPLGDIDEWHWNGDFVK